ncbi:hypothetical protein Tco_1324676 [Tanacetum coccineum]
MSEKASKKAHEKENDIRCRNKLPTDLSPNLHRRKRTLLLYQDKMVYEEDPNKGCLEIPQVVWPTRAFQTYMHSEEHDSLLSKMINTVDGEFKFGMEIPYTIINDAIKQLVRYKYYMIKKGQSEEDNDEEESEEQVVSRAGRGRGKGYMCSGNQEVNVSSKPKKDVVPRKQRTITYADNILKTKDRVVLLAKSVSTEKQRRQ